MEPWLFNHGNYGLPVVFQFFAVGYHALGEPFDRQEALMDIDAALLDYITRTIAGRFHPRRIILFGSHARGEAHPDSDLDLFIEMETNRRPPERALEVDAVFGLRSWPMDILVYTPDEVERLRDEPGSLLATIEREGSVLYERS